MARPIRVLQVYRTFFPDTQGGAEEVVRQIAVGVSQLGCESRIFVPSPNPFPKEINISGIPVIRSKMQFEIASCGFALGALREFRRQVEWADVVHYHFPWPFADLLDWLEDVRKPKVITYHSDIVRQKALLILYQPLMEKFLRSADRIVATSTQYMTSSQTLAELDNVNVVPIGIDEASYPNPNQNERQSVLERFGSGYFLFVGMLRYYKGLHILLEACREQDFKVVIAGIGPEEENLRAQARQAGLENVQFAGRVTDAEKIALIDNSLAMIFPSHLRSEAFGVTLLEGLMRSKPLITAEVGTGTSYVNAHDETGYVVTAGDPVSLRGAMNKLREEGVAHSFGMAARDRFERLFTAKDMCAAYLKIYSEVAMGEV